MKESYSFERKFSGVIYLVKGSRRIAIYCQDFLYHPNWPEGFWLDPTSVERTRRATYRIEIEKFYHQNRDEIIEQCKKFMVKEML